MLHSECSRLKGSYSFLEWRYLAKYFIVHINNFFHKHQFKKQKQNKT